MGRQQGRARAKARPWDPGDRYTTRRTADEHEPAADDPTAERRELVERLFGSSQAPSSAPVIQWGPDGLLHRSEES